MSAERPSGVPTLADDSRLATLGYGALTGGCVVVLVPATLIGLSVGLRTQGIDSDGLLSAGVASIPTLFVLWLAVFVWFRFAFYREAVRVSGAPPPGQVPLDVEAAHGVIDGKPEVVLLMRTRSTAGRHGNCRVELYPDGVQIVNPRHLKPRWQFSYANLVHAESITMVSVGGRTRTSRHFVRLIAARPRMAFFLSSTWFANGSVHVLIDKLREHAVAVFDESFEV